MTIIAELFEFVRCLLGRDLAATDHAALEVTLLTGRPHELPAGRTSVRRNPARLYWEW